jgi:hypothetical protein
MEILSIEFQHDLNLPEETMDFSISPGLEGIFSDLVAQINTNSMFSQSNPHVCVSSIIWPLQPPCNKHEPRNSSSPSPHD